MPEFMTAHRVARKVDWEGGVIDALVYGLHATHLDPDDETSKPLREAWAALEAAYREHYEPLERKVAAILEDLEETDDEDDDE